MIACRLISINKPHTDRIFSGEKQIEWRKGDALSPGKYLVYETKNKGGCGMVIGEFFVVIVAHDVTPARASEEQIKLGCVALDDLAKYAGESDLQALYIATAKRYNEPKPLSDFWARCRCSCVNCKDPRYFNNACEERGVKKILRPPQSWCYVEDTGER